MLLFGGDFISVRQSQDDGDDNFATKFTLGTSTGNASTLFQLRAHCFGV